MTSGSDRNADGVRRQPGAVGRLDRDPRRRASSTTSRASRPAASGSGRTRSSWSATSRAGRCSTSSATSGSTRCRGPGSGRGSPAPTSRRPPSSWRGRSPTSSASRTRASSSRTCTTCPTSSTATFDVVYTSRGVLGWLPDIRGWARVVAHFVAPGGRFFITEIHPVAQVVRERGRRAGRAPPRPTRTGSTRAAHLRRSRARTPTRRPTSASTTEHGWDHGLGEIVTALIDAGLRIESLVEHPFLEWKADFLVDDDGRRRWRLPPDAGGELPLMFSLLASKPADEPGLGAQNPSDAQAGPPGASISSTRTPWHDRGWRNATGPSAPSPRGGVDELDAVDLEAEQRLGEVRDLEADVVEALALALEEARDAGRVVGRLDELDLRLADPQERDPDAVVRDVHDRLELEAERVAPQARATSSIERTMSATWWTRPIRRTCSGRRETGGVGGTRAAYPARRALDRGRQRRRGPRPAPAGARAPARPLGLGGERRASRRTSRSSSRSCRSTS